MINPIKQLKDAVNKREQLKKEASSIAKNQLEVINAAKKVSNEIKNGEG
jgi:hypothetical protein